MHIDLRIFSNWVEINYTLFLSTCFGKGLEARHPSDFFFGTVKIERKNHQKWLMFLCAQIPSASGFGLLGFGYLNAFAQGGLEH